MKKRKQFTILMGVAVALLAGCGNANLAEKTGEEGSAVETQVAESDVPEEAESSFEEQSLVEETPDQSSVAEDEDGKVLVAYFSRAGENYGVGVIEKGNTEIIAEMIAEETGGDLFKIETVTPYPEGYDETVDIAQQEKSENARPELTAAVDNIQDYKVVWIGFPCWHSDMPMAVYTFLESYDFSGKTIIPFCTHGGSGLSATPESIAEICPDAEVLAGYAITGTTAQNEREEALAKVREWVAEAMYERI